MKIVTIKQIAKKEINWVNTKYDEVNFVRSAYENEFIVVAKVDNENAGLGRLVKIDETNIELGGILTFPEYRGMGVAEKIVGALCDRNPFKNATIWCLPFEDLLNFYSRFGFKLYDKGAVPAAVLEKLEYCNSGNRYEKRVILLYKTQ